MVLHGLLDFVVHVTHVLRPQLGAEAQIVAHVEERHSSLLACV
jgi:hypothetical protein